MLRPLAFATGLALCFLSGWSTAAAQVRVPVVSVRVGKSTTTKVFNEGTARATKAHKSLKEFRGGHGEHATVHSEQDTFAYTVKGWKLTLDKPVRFNLPFGGNFELSEIDLKDATIIAGGLACSQVESCVELVKKICALIPGSKCDSVLGPKKVDIAD